MTEVIREGTEDKSERVPLNPDQRECLSSIIRKIEENFRKKKPECPWDRLTSDVMDIYFPVFMPKPSEAVQLVDESKKVFAMQLLALLY